MGQEVLFYDGSCGLCDRAVYFVLKRDRAALFRFAPLGGERYRREIVPRLGGSAAPDAMGVFTADGRLIWGADAALHILARLDPFHASVARLLGRIPRPIREGVYRLVARLRRRLVRPPTCAVIDSAHRARFDP